MEDIKIKATPPFKLHKEHKRSFQFINLRKQFGFLPETIIVQRIPGTNNVLIVCAVLTPEEIKKQKAMKVKDKS